jgi:hypothetical protein
MAKKLNPNGNLGKIEPEDFFSLSFRLSETKPLALTQFSYPQ